MPSPNNHNEPKYICWFLRENIVLEDGTPINSYKLEHKCDEDIINEWAIHIRRHYISDEELMESIETHGISSKDYLCQYVIPQKEDAFGCSSRSNDISEIIVSDLFEYILSYTVPRCKQNNRSGKTQSEHGTDIIAYRFHNQKKPNKMDELLAIEVKAGLSSDKYTPIIDAISDSQSKDEHRHAHTLDYYRKKLKMMGNIAQAEEISRFQLKPEYPYQITYIGAGLITKDVIQNDILIGITKNSIQLKSINKIYLIHGKNLMDLTHNLYQRCSG